ncbi:hypothetical protein ERJ75_000117500 [Trypanosoma vivax]|uniref:Uncharacterized protein n=1 Tax=Trypanosoma vivax (strain Y486) TaxID=1055687 RepID=G0TSC8_TRYVY|nr:hypothetical protein TRVL_07515 [Trypanosoma vivax]KAH8605457.1 hypothetical protein ERJ75_001592800 [Trypanosoma vivax]KAH8619908.1 hypothetical protein ERJ75_000117500 [Trypanosoma vivax]CCC46854.1 conserved hypothetical protein [Trypanosoma vivax Y486]
MHSPITEAELRKYLPNFDCDLDPQVGEWVIVTPARRGPLLDPLIDQIQEQAVEPIYPFSYDHNTSEVLVNDGPDVSNQTGAPPKLQRVFFQTVEEIRRKYQRRCFYSSSNETRKGRCGGAKEEEEDDDTILYLNPRALLLTPCAPAVFGGSDFIEGLDSVTGRVVFQNWRTGEVRTDVDALRSLPVPEWAEGFAEKSLEEWKSWLRRTAARFGDQNGSSSCPPLRKKRTE